MDRMLVCFVGWAAAVRTEVLAAGRWCDAVDPLTGVPLFGGPGEATWNEVHAAAALLGYATSDHGVCPVVLHPVHGVLRPRPSSPYSEPPRTCVLVCAMGNWAPEVGQSNNGGDNQSVFRLH